MFRAEVPGRETTAGAFATSMARILVEPVSPEAKLRFRTELARALKAAERRSVLWIGCDYHPDPILAAAAEKSGIPEANFPWKTNMWLLESGAVQVRPGYHADVQEL